MPECTCFTSVLRLGVWLCENGQQAITVRTQTATRGKWCGLLYRTLTVAYYSLLPFTYYSRADILLIIQVLIISFKR